MYTWAAGNGGESFDSCSADGYVQSIYTIPVGAYNQYGGPAYYDEMCSAKMTVVYVDNTILLDPDLQVVREGTNDGCFNIHSIIATTLYESNTKFLFDEITVNKPTHCGVFHDNTVFVFANNNSVSSQCTDDSVANQCSTAIISIQCSHSISLSLVKIIMYM